MVGLYHALNRENVQAEIFKKQEDYVAFEKILAGALAIQPVQLLSYLLMPNHDHLVVRPLVDGEMSRFMAWIGGTHTMQYRAHYHTSGMGHVYQQRDKNFPVQDDNYFFVVCRYVERDFVSLTPFFFFFPVAFFPSLKWLFHRVSCVFHDAFFVLHVFVFSCNYNPTRISTRFQRPKWQCYRPTN